ncbi:MAG: ATP-dependent DNA helicase PcrA, partial [Geobacter sp.]
HPFNPPSRFFADICPSLLDMEEEYHPLFSFGKFRILQEPLSGQEATAPHNLAAVFGNGAEQDLNEIQVVPEEAADVFIGMRVRHGKFGVGAVRKIEGRGDEQKVIVWFNSVGPKKLLVRFAGLERV